jgi:hypothetical protein
MIVGTGAMQGEVQNYKQQEFVKLSEEYLRLVNSY